MGSKITAEQAHADGRHGDENNIEDLWYWALVCPICEAHYRRYISRTKGSGRSS